MVSIQRDRKLPVVSLALVGLLAFGGTAFAQDGSEVTLAEQNGSGITGTAMLEDLGNGTTRVTVKLENAGPGPQPIHIHPGSCATLDPKPQWPLTNVMNGESITEVQASPAEIGDGKHAINVHKSAEEAAVYVACGDIAAMAGGAGAAAAETPRAAAGATTEPAMAATTEPAMAETPGAATTATSGGAAAETPGAMMAETPGAMMEGTPHAMMAETPGAMMEGTPHAMMGGTPSAMGPGMAETPGAMMGGDGGKGPGMLPASGSDTTNWMLVSLLGILGLGGVGAGAWLRRRSIRA